MNKTIRTLITSAALSLARLSGSAAGASSSPPSSAATQAQDPSAARFDAAAQLEGQININTASAAELEQLPGIGPSIAGRIVHYRSAHPFKEPNHLMRVKGVGKKTYLAVKPYVIIEGESTLRVAGK